MTRFIVKKEINAKNITEAIRNEKRGEVIDVYRDETKQEYKPDAIGFTIDTTEDEDE